MRDIYHPERQLQLDHAGFRVSDFIHQNRNNLVIYSQDIMTIRTCVTDQVVKRFTLTLKTLKLECCANVGVPGLINYSKQFIFIMDPHSFHGDRLIASAEHYMHKLLYMCRISLAKIVSTADQSHL